MGSGSRAFSTDLPRRSFFSRPALASPAKFASTRSGPFTISASTPDARRLVFVANEPGEDVRVFVQDIEGDAPPRALTPPGYDRGVLSPDGKWVAARSADRKWWLIPVDEGEKRLAPGVLDGERLAGWSADSLALFVYRPERVTRVYRVEMDDGAREFWKEVSPLDPVGAQMAGLLVAPEANAYVLSSRRLLSELYLVEGLK
jgi:hypothetical protein